MDGKFSATCDGCESQVEVKTFSEGKCPNCGLEYYWDGGYGTWWLYWENSKKNK